MRRLKIIFICKLTICLLTWSVFVAELNALRGSAVVLQARAKVDKKISDQDEAIELDENGEQIELNVTTTTKPTLTGIPQIDYVHDPNLPRELNGYNLSDYPFLNSVPEEIDFKCDGLHDGFYASMPHKCQLYHHCLFGTRFDFLCANYTAFDQKTFICHFVSQVDCPNSAKYYNRNEALYKAAETTTLSTTTTSTSTTPSPPPPQQQQQQQQQQLSFYPQYQQQPQQQHMPYDGRRAMPPGFAQGFAQGRKRRPTYRRRRPVYEYYYVDDYDDQQDYYDESVEHVMPVAKKPARKHSRLNNYKPTDLDVDYPESSSESDRAPSGNFKHRDRGTAAGQQQQQQQEQQQQQQTVVTKNVSNQITSVYDKPRAPPKIRRPVPINERDRYDYTSASKTGQQSPAAPVAAAAPTPTTTTTTTTEAPSTKAAANASKSKEPPRPVTEEVIEYYDEDELEEEYVAEPEVPAVKPAVLKPEPIKPAKAATRTTVVADYDSPDRNRRPPAVAAGAVRSKVNRGPVQVPQSQPQPAQAVVARKKPTTAAPVDHGVVVGDEYEDEVPAAATRQSIAAATKQRASGPFLVRPAKPAKAKLQPPAAVAVDDVQEDEEEPVIYKQQPARQSQRVSVRQVMASSHRHRSPQLQQSAADHPHTQYNNNKQVRAAASTNSRRPARPVYEYADEYYDEE